MREVVFKDTMHFRFRGFNDFLLVLLRGWLVPLDEHSGLGSVPFATAGYGKLLYYSVRVRPTRVTPYPWAVRITRHPDVVPHDVF